MVLTLWVGQVQTIAPTTLVAWLTRPFARDGKVFSLQALPAQRVHACVHACASVRSDQDLAEGQTADVIIILGYALFR